MLFEGTITGSKEIYNLPAGRKVQIHSTASLDIAFWFPLLNAYGSDISVASPVSIVPVGHNRARITGNAEVRILLSQEASSAANTSNLDIATYLNLAEANAVLSIGQVYYDQTLQSLNTATA